MFKEGFRKISPELEKPPKKITEKDIKINPKLLEPYFEKLDQVKEGGKKKYMDTALDDFDRTIDKAYEYALSNNVDFETAFSKVMSKKKRYNPSKK